MGSILSGSAIDISGIHSAQLTWAHLFPDRVLFMAPPLRSHKMQTAEPRMPKEQGRHNQLPSGTCEHYKSKSHLSGSTQYSNAKLSLWREQQTVRNWYMPILQITSLDRVTRWSSIYSSTFFTFQISNLGFHERTNLHAKNRAFTQKKKF